MRHNLRSETCAQRRSGESTDELATTYPIQRHVTNNAVCSPVSRSQNTSTDYFLHLIGLIGEDLAGLVAAHREDQHVVHSMSRCKNVSDGIAVGCSA